MNAATAVDDHCPVRFTATSEHHALTALAGHRTLTALSCRPAGSAATSSVPRRGSSRSPSHRLAGLPAEGVRDLDPEEAAVTGPARHTEAVWLLWDHGHLRDVYRHRGDADHDAGALRRAAIDEDGHPPDRDAITVDRVELRRDPRW